MTQQVHGGDLHAAMLAQLLTGSDCQPDQSVIMRIPAMLSVCNEGP